MNSIQIEYKSYNAPEFTVTHFLTIADIDRSARFYERVFDGRILSGGDRNGAPAYIQVANTGLVVTAETLSSPP